MGTIIIANAVKREPNKLYYIDKEGNLCEATMHRNGRIKGIKNTQNV